jgi:hypothetical protein
MSERPLRPGQRSRALRLVCGLSGVSCLLLSCARGGATLPNTPTRAIGFAALESGPAGDRCRALPGREAVQYDTSGDGRADVRKVYVAINAGIDSRLVLICRESDINGDGRKDVVRYYDDQGRSAREESDRNFDGKLDRALVFRDGQVSLEELDENRDGKMDTKIFFEAGKPSRAERDLDGRSRAGKWHPDRWEYYEGGMMVRMGTDLDGDSRVDRWERDRFSQPSKATDERVDPTLPP